MWPNAQGIVFGDSNWSLHCVEPVLLEYWLAPYGAGLYIILVQDQSATPRPFRAIYVGETDDFRYRGIQSDHHARAKWALAASLSYSPLYITTCIDPSFLSREVRRDYERRFVHHYSPVCNDKPQIQSGYVAAAALTASLAGLAALYATRAAPTATKRRVFLSFVNEDRAQVNGLRLLNANDDFDIDFYDESVRTAIDSTNAEYIKRKLRDKIRRSGLTLCLIGQTTYTSQWVAWEIEESVRQRKPVIAMALKGVSRAILPAVVKRLGLVVHPWDHEALARLIARA